MKTVKVVWKSISNGRFWLGVAFESGDFFASRPVECINKSAHDKYDVGNDIEVPAECL